MKEPAELCHWSSRVTELPPLPAILEEVLQALDSGSLSTQRCIHLIEHDPALAARLLRLANSAFYGRPGAIGSISGAVSLLGLRTVVGVLAAASLHGGLQVDQCPEFSVERYWQQAMGSALISASLATPLGLDASHAFLAGLMHDIGQPMLARLEPEAYERVLRLQDSPEAQPQLELAMVGMAHTTLGAQAARHWHFPAEIVQAIEGHHRPLGDAPRPPTTLAELIQLCDHIVLAIEHDRQADGHSQVAEQVWESLRVSPAERPTYFERIAVAVSDFARLL